MTFDVDPSAGMLAGSGPRRIPERIAHPGLLVEVASDGFVGAVVRCTAHDVVLRDRRGRERRFGNHPGAFIVDDRRVTLVVPTEHPMDSKVARPPLTASGSFAVETTPRVARASRLLVEGVHDAELIEHVWGDDLRVEGVVVEVLHGADDLSEMVRAFGPGPGRRLGVLLDHLVEGSKESRLARGVDHPFVAIAGHPFVDIWAAVRPEAVGVDGWPEVPRGRPWKAAIAAHLGVANEQEAWRLIRASVASWRDLDRSLIGAVEYLIDFVTASDP